MLRLVEQREYDGGLASFRYWFYGQLRWHDGAVEQISIPDDQGGVLPKEIVLNGSLEALGLSPYKRSHVNRPTEIFVPVGTLIRFTLDQDRVSANTLTYVEAPSQKGLPCK